MKALLISFMTLVPGIGLADVSLSYPQQAQCKTTIAEMQVSGSRMRVDSLMDGQSFSMQYDGMEDMVTMLDHNNRGYRQVEVDEDALDYNKDVVSSTGTYIDNQMKNLQVQMKQQCAQLEKQGMSCPNMDLSSVMQTAQAMMGQDMAKVEIRLSEKKQTVAGMDCKTYERYENGRKTREECYIEPGDLQLPDKDKKYLLRNLKVMVRYGDTFSGLTERFHVASTDASSLPDPATKEILLSQVCLAPGGAEIGRVEVQVIHDAVDESRFDIPAGYREMSMTGQD